MFRSLLKALGGGDRAKVDAERLVDATLRQALAADFYRSGDAPDTFDGRFEMACLHAVLVLRALRREGEAVAPLTQAYTDRLFLSFDDALRDLGTGDSSIARKVRKMGEALYGRARSYGAALDAAEDDALAVALARNIANDARPVEAFAKLAAYARAADGRLTAQSVADMVASGPDWPAAT